MDRIDKKSLAPFVAYLFLFHAAWVAWVYLLFPSVRALGERTLTYALVNIGVRLLVWVLPVLLYLHFVEHVKPIEYLRLKQRWKRGLQIGLGFTCVNFLLLLIRFGMPNPNAQLITWNNVLSTSLLIGFVEELPYRGFILQKLQERLSFWVANAVSSLLFLAIHLPGWISLHMLSAETFVFVFIFGMLMSIVFRYSGSLWSAIIAHSLNDFLNAVVFHR